MSPGNCLQIIRSRIWGPTNFLVYLGLREYGFEDVRKEFAQKSNKLLMKDWLARGYIYENWNAVTGQGDDVDNSIVSITGDPFWDISI